MNNITILMACKNNLKDVIQTLDSINSISTSGYVREIIILDDSVDAEIKDFCNTIREGNPKVEYFKCNAKNLFDAWNMGVDKANGNYIWFLNSGDLSTATTELLSEFLDDDRIYDYIFFDYFTKAAGEEAVEKYVKSWLYVNELKLLSSILPCHQAMLFSKVILDRWNLKYNVKYKISGDSELIFSYISKCENYLYIAKPICVFILGGISNRYRTIWHAIAHYQDLIKSRKVKNPKEKTVLMLGLIKKYLIQLFEK